MAARSNHPVSRCIAEELARIGARLSPSADVEEEPGVGLTLRRSGHVFRLGKDTGSEGADQEQPTTSRPLAPLSINTMPVTTSPLPFMVTAPWRNSAPIFTSATSRT